MNIIHIQHLSTDNHSPLFYNSSGIEFMDFSIPLKNETIITKNVNSAFIGTNLSEVLRENNIGQIYIVGLTTDHCVSTTTRMASNLGFNVTIIEDACATFEKHFKEKVINAETLHLTNLASLNNEFACITTTEKLLQHTYPVQKF